MGSKQKAKTSEAKGFKAGASTSITPAEVVEVLERVNTKQGGMQVRCKLLEGSEEGKIMRRNVYGPVRVGDILLLRETEIEAMATKGRKG